MRSLFVSKFLLLAIVGLMVQTTPATAASSSWRIQQREIEVINDSGVSIEIYEVKIEEAAAAARELVLLEKGHVGSNVTIRAPVGEVEIREVCNDGTAASDLTCRRAILEVAKGNEKQVYTVTKEFDVEATLSESQQKSVDVVNGMIRECQAQGSEADTSCVLQKFAKYVERTTDALTFETNTREKLASTLEEYSCQDNSLSSSIPIKVASWEDPVQKQSLPVQVMHEHASSNIHVLENFIGQEECDAILKIAEADGLNRASVAGNMQNSNKFRKALQTNVAIPWDKENEGHPIARVGRRIYDYTNHALRGLNITEAGQSNLKYLHYTGRGRDDMEPDHYTGHTDGLCAGQQHQRGARVATMVLYCKTAEDGGHTNFMNVGVHVAAKPGDAVFFSYVDPTTMTMDNGYTMHSGCPVYEGDKKIITQWIRYGVDEDHPYNSFRGVF